MFKRIGLYLLTVIALIVLPHGSASGQNEKKTAYGLLLDNTLSLESQFAQVQSLGKGVVKRIHVRGDVSLFNFVSIPLRVSGAPEPPDARMVEGRTTTKITMGVDWSEDQSELNDYIDGLTVATGLTQLFDAIRAMAEELNVHVDSEKDSYNDKIIILITDGDQLTQSDSRFIRYPDETRVRRKQIEGLVKDLKGSGIKVYAVGLLGELNAYGGSSGRTQKEQAEYFLKKITKETGGKAVITMKGKVNVDKALEELFTK